MSWAFIEPIMRLSKVDFIVLALAILGSITTLGEASEMKGPLSQDAIIQLEIYYVIGAQQTAWNRGDIDAFMNGYARSDSTTLVSEDKVTRGWHTVHDRYKKKYSDRAKMGALTFSDLEIMPLSRDSAVVLGSWKLKRAADQPHGRFTLIFRLRNDGWRIVYDHTSTAPPPH
jgi:ketosteroid isomerase-like protein